MVMLCVVVVMLDVFVVYVRCGCVILCLVDLWLQ